jgi:hypothetical protein
LDIARAEGCTHFLNIDVDEYYENFESAKRAYIDSGCYGSVCKLYTYFKKPTWRFENPDNYFVPFIHKLDENTKCGRSTYPYWVDPTRTVNTPDVALLADVYMDHFSWVRKSIDRKTRNSSARRNIEKTTLLQDYNSPDLAPGYLVKDYQNMKLIEVENKYGIEI